jgi:hypothetical protein
VEPAFTSLNGTDPVSCILSANVARRNVTKGQRAMAAALLVSETETSRDERGAIADAGGFSTGRLGQAQSVRNHGPELAGAVMAGTMPLNEAYAEARQRKEATESREEQARRPGRG